MPGTLNELTPEEKGTFSEAQQQVAAAPEVAMRRSVFFAVWLGLVLSLLKGKNHYLLFCDLSRQLLCGSEWIF